MAKRPLPTPEELRQLLRYEPETGKLYWLERKDGSPGSAMFNTRFAGNEALTAPVGEKALCGSVNGGRYLAHRVIWALVHGEWPTGQIDHINGNPFDNRLSNLREVESFENQRNMKRPSHNTSGVCGVSWNAQHRKWQARINARRKTVMLGVFSDFNEAVAARKQAEKEYGYHPNHGRD